MKRLTALIFTLLLFASAVHATENPISIESEGPIRPLLVDRMHTGVKTRLDKYAQYFDNFFVDDRADEEAGESQFRLIGSIEHRESNGFNFTPRIKARLNLPHLQRKVNLLIDTETDDISSLTDQNSGIESSGDLKEDTSIALQLVQKSNQKFGLSHRLSFNSKKGRLNPKFGSRVRFTFQPYERNLLRFTQSVFWGTVDHFGQESRLDYEYLLHRRNPETNSLFRATIRGLYSEISDGYEWSLPVEVFNALPNQRAYSYGGAISGVTDSDSGITNSTVFFRYRQSFLRKWLFFDITPRLEWPKAEGRNTTALITFSLEVVL